MKEDELIKYLSKADIQAVAKSAQKAKDLISAEVVKNNGIVIYLDVLGWKNKCTNEENALNKLTFLLQDLITTKLGLIKALENKTAETFAQFNYAKGEDSIEIIGAADTIAIFIKDYYMQAFIRAYVLINCLVKSGAEQGLFFRGALSYGEYSLIKDSNFYMGPAVNEVSQWYEACDWVGVIMTPSAVKKFAIMELILKAGNPNGIFSEYVKYNRIPFKKSNEAFESYVVNCFYKREDIFNYKEKLSIEKERIEKLKADVSIINKYENALNFYQYVKNNGLLL